jgi:hypothetical protein
LEKDDKSSDALNEESSNEQSGSSEEGLENRNEQSGSEDFFDKVVKLAEVKKQI